MRKAFYAICLILFVFPLYSEPAVYLKPRSVVRSPIVKLSDIAKFSPEIQDRELKISISEPTRILPESIRDELQGIKILGKDCLLIPLNRTVDSDEILSSLSKEINRKTGADFSSFRLQMEDSSVLLPSKSVDFKWSNPGRHLTPGQKIIQLEVFFQGERVYSERIRYTVEMKTEYYAAKYPIVKTQKLSEENFEKKTEFLLEPMTDLWKESVNGLTALVNLETGAILRKKHVRNSFTVDKGSEVELFFSEGNITVKTKGIARQSGNRGDRIKLVTANRTVLTGRVIDKGLVSLE